MTMTPKQCIVARALLGLSRDALARRTRGAVSPRTIDNFELGAHEARADTLATLEAFFERAGISFARDGVNAWLNAKKRKV